MLNNNKYAIIPFCYTQYYTDLRWRKRWVRRCINDLKAVAWQEEGYSAIWQIGFDELVATRMDKIRSDHRSFIVEVINEV